MCEWILGSLGRTRVRVFIGDEERTKRERKEERERKKKNERTGSLSFYIDAWIGRVLTRPSALHLGPLELGLDGSGSIQRLWGILEIRIHQVAWVWAPWPWALDFFHFFMIFVAMHTFILVIWTPERFNFLAKIPKKLPCVSWCIFDCFVILLHVKNGLKMYANFSTNLCTLCIFFVKFLAWLLI